MKNVRIMLGYCPVYGKDLSHELIKLDNVEFCYNAAEYYCYTEEDGKIENFNQRLGRETIYDKVYDLNKLPALSKDLLEKMLPYESMIIKLSSRRIGFPTVDYEKEKRNYHKHLRFWNHILDEYKINMIFFEEFPHISYTYLIYCLGKIKGIPMLLCNVTSIPGIRVYGTSIEDVGVNIHKYYESVCKNMSIEECCLSETVQEFYNKYTKPIKEIKEERKKNQFEKMELKRVTNYNYGSYMGVNAFAKAFRKRIHLIWMTVYQHKGKEWYRSHKDEIACIKEDSYKIRFYKKNNAMWLKQYNKMAIEPDYSKKYIYFGLQLTPEETTMPRAGVFSEQYTSIQLMARAAEKENVFVYVKEHFVQTFRDKEVYKLLKSIPNVRLIKTSESSFDLMSNSIAVATQTGTCILEGALLGKPALVVSEGCFWKGMPGVFEITNEEQGAQVIHKILSGYHTEQNEIRKYFYAIQENTLKCYIQKEFWKQSDKSEHKESVKRMLGLIDDFIEKHEIPDKNGERLWKIK